MALFSHYWGFIHQSYSMFYGSTVSYVVGFSIHHHIPQVLLSGPVRLQSLLSPLFQRVGPLFHPLNRASIAHYHRRHSITILLGYLLSRSLDYLVLHSLFQAILLLLHLGFCHILQNTLPDVASLWPSLVGLECFRRLSHLLLL